jgi:GTP-binding protein EngB required for normal cell division
LLALTVQASAQTAPAPAPGDGSFTRAEIRELLDAMKATAKASRENVDYARVVPDILFQILTKLDKIEDKLDKIEEATKTARKR